MNFQRLNNVGRLADRRTHNLNELDVNQVYCITRVILVPTQYGDWVIDIDDPDIPRVYLPLRIGRYFRDNPEEFNGFQREVEGGYMIIKYLGGQRQLIEFINDTLQEDPEIPTADLPEDNLQNLAIGLPPVGNEVSIDELTFSQVFHESQDLFNEVLQNGNVCVCE